MAEYVDKKHIYDLFEGTNGVIRLHVAQLDQIPAADVVEVVHGRWEDTGIDELDLIYGGWKCSACGYIFCGNKTNFCPDCGAKMEG